MLPCFVTLWHVSLTSNVSTNSWLVNLNVCIKQCAAVKNSHLAVYQSDRTPCVTTFKSWGNTLSLYNCDTNRHCVMLTHEIVLFFIFMTIADSAKSADPQSTVITFFCDGYFRRIVGFVRLRSKGITGPMQKGGVIIVLRVSGWLLDSSYFDILHQLKDKLCGLFISVQPPEWSAVVWWLLMMFKGLQDIGFYHFRTSSADALNSVEPTITWCWLIDHV